MLTLLRPETRHANVSEADDWEIFEFSEWEDDFIDDLPPLEDGDDDGRQHCEWEVVPCTEEATYFYEYKFIAPFSDDPPGKERKERVYLCGRHFVFKMRSIIHNEAMLDRNPIALEDMLVAYGRLSDPHYARSSLEDTLDDAPDEEYDPNECAWEWLGDDDD